MTEPGLTDEQVQYYLRLLFARVDARVERTQNPDWLALEPGSALVGDDRATKPYQTSHAVSQGISAAIEALHALKSLLADASILHPATPFVLARVAIEAAANAAWILTPTGRPERVRRRLVLATLDVEDGEKAATEVGLTPPRSQAERLAEIQELATRANGGSRPNLGKGRGATGRIRDVDADVSSAPILFWWMVGSGFAHGRPWASISLLRATDQVDLGDGVLRRRPVSSLDRVLIAAGAADFVTTHALELFKLRGAADPDASATAWMHAYDAAMATQVDQAIVDSAPDN